MPDPTPTPKALTATPSSARALAAAGAGETVTLRVAMATGLPPEARFRNFTETPDEGTFAVFALREEDGPFEWVRAPVAEGERVVVECPDCEGEGYWPFEVEVAGRVTREMAVAGGDPDLEGTLYSVRQEAGREPCEICRGDGSIPATVLATPTPERWCEEAEMDCSLETLEAAGLAVRSVEFCRGCRENLLHVWRVEVRREGGDA